MRLGFDDTRTLMKEIDSDGTGSINYREFVRFLRGSGSDGDKAVVSGSGSGDSASRPALKLSDRVSSELRSKFDAAISSGKIRSYEDVFKAMDKDGNGTVSRREFEDGLADLRVSVCVCERGCVCVGGRRVMWRVEGRSVWAYTRGASVDGAWGWQGRLE